MTKYPSNSWLRKALIGTMATVIAAVMLEIVAGGMAFRDPGVVAARAQFLATQAERARQLRAPQGPLQMAAAPDARCVQGL